MIKRIVISETSLARHSVARWCVGNGVDCGCGGDSIIPTSIGIDRPQGHPDRADFGISPTHLTGDAFNLYWFKDGVLDYVYNSHCIEDAQFTGVVILEYLRVLKPGGHLIICAPDQEAYVEFSNLIGDTPNSAHKHSNFGLQYVLDCCSQIGIPESAIVHKAYPVDYSPYSFELVIKKP